MLLSNSLLVVAQSRDSVKWEFSAEANNYLIPGNYILNPIVYADRDKLHLEARYNYEDFNTVSGWVGYNLSFGKKLQASVTPMVGFAAGNTNGIAPGLEFDLTYKKLEFYSESEWLFNTSDKYSSYYYNWSDFVYNANDWLKFGVSIQRTRLYQSGLEVQKAPLVGFTYKKWELTTYGFNIGTETAFVLLSLDKEF